MDIRSLVFDEYSQLIRDGHAPADAADRVAELVEEFGGVDELWKQFRSMFVQMVHGQEMRARRTAAASAALETRELVAAGPGTIAKRVHDPVILRSSLMNQFIYVGNRIMTYGEMTASDWLEKADYYRMKSEHAGKREAACVHIASLIKNKTTAQVLSDTELADLIPAEGL